MYDYEHSKEWREGKSAYYKLQCEYSIEINPYKFDYDVEMHEWRQGFIDGYFEQSRFRLERGY